MTNLSSRSNKFRFEKTDFGWKAYLKTGRAFVFIGHFYTKREAVEAAESEPDARETLTDAAGAITTKGRNAAGQDHQWPNRLA